MAIRREMAELIDGAIEFGSKSKDVSGKEIV